MTDVFRILTVPETIRPQVVEFVNHFGPSAQGMWPRPNYRRISDGSLWALNNGMIGEEFAAMMTSPQALIAGAASMGVTVDLATATAMLSACDVSNQTIAEVVQRMGLERLPEVAQ